MPVRLTDTAISKAARDSAENGERRDLADSTCPGLRLRVTPAGGKSWVLACRDREGRMRRFPLGTYPVIGIGAARKAAGTLRQDVRVRGTDPIAAARAERAAGRDATAGIGTLTALLDHYEAVRGQQLRSWSDCRRQISNVFRSHMDRPVTLLTRLDLQGAADRHGAKQAAAAAVRYIRPVLRWAGKRNLVDPSIAVLDPPAKVQQRERVLTDAELVAIWQGVEAADVPPTFSKLIRLLILTGQRREEVAAMAWSELSADRGTWTIPTARHKGGAGNVVPLSEVARAIIPADEPDRATRMTDLVFPGQRNTPFSGWSKAKTALDKAAGVSAWRIHDIRRTVATGLQRLGVRLEVTEAVLGHVSGSRAGVVGIYQRHDWAVKKQAALIAWTEHVMGLVANRPVVPLRLATERLTPRASLPIP